MFLISEAGNFLIIAIIGVFIIVLALIIYFLISGKKKEDVIETTHVEKPKEFFENNSQNITNQSEKVSTLENSINDIALEENAKTIQDNGLNSLETQIDNNTIEENEENNAITNIQTVLSEMQKDLNASKKSEEEIARYEDEEEKNAIISYKELMKYKDSQSKDILLEDKSKEEIKETITNNQDGVKKFKKSEFISPIFGYNDDSNVTYHEIKRPPRKEKSRDTEIDWESNHILKDLDDSVEVIKFEEKEDNVSDNTMRFLDELVDFRKKLD